MFDKTILEQLFNGQGESIETIVIPKRVNREGNKINKIKQGFILVDGSVFEYKPSPRNDEQAKINDLRFKEQLMRERYNFSHKQKNFDAWDWKMNKNSDTVIELINNPIVLLNIIGETK